MRASENLACTKNCFTIVANFVKLPPNFIFFVCVVLLYGMSVWETSTSCVRQCSSFLGANTETKLRRSVNPAFLLGLQSFVLGCTEEPSSIFCFSVHFSYHLRPWTFRCGKIMLVIKKHVFSVLGTFYTCVGRFSFCFRLFELCAMFTAPIKSVQVALVTFRPFLSVQTCFVGSFVLQLGLFPTSRLHAHSKCAVTTIFSTCKIKKNEIVWLPQTFLFLGGGEALSCRCVENADESKMCVEGTSLMPPK